MILLLLLNLVLLHVILRITELVVFGDVIFSKTHRFIFAILRLSGTGLATVSIDDTDFISSDSISTCFKFSCVVGCFFMILFTVIIFY